jgi:hypothetical protein
MSDPVYAIRVRTEETETVNEIEPTRFGVKPEQRADVVFRNTVFPLRKARATATVELLRDGEVARTEEVTPDDKFIEITRSVGGYAHTQIWGSFSGPVTDEDIRAAVYHSRFGGRGLSIDRNRNTFYGVRHDD